MLLLLLFTKGTASTLLSIIIYDKVFCQHIIFLSHYATGFIHTALCSVCILATIIWSHNFSNPPNAITMKIQTASLLLSLAASASAFAPSPQAKGASTLRMSTEGIDMETPVETEVEDVVAPINGWVADESLPCYGLPGALAPTGFFDPLGFAQKGISLEEVKRNREAEVMHGRVAMLASVGYLVGESFGGPFGLTGPANDQLAQVPLPAMIILTLGIGAAELKRATIGWVEPDLGDWTKTLWRLRDNYYPGDVGFDPLGLKPDDAQAFKNMQTRELQNGRLAMLGVAGMCAQELVNHRTIFETLDFYSKVSSGANPYAACGDALIC
mgnify:CR=1 FL=1